MAPSIPERATVAELEGILELSRTAIYKHIKKGHLEPDGKRRYATGAIMDAVLRHRAEDNRLKGHGELKAKKLQIEAALLEAKLAELEGRLVDKERAAKDNFQDGRTLRDAFLAIPDRLDAQLAAERDAHKCGRILRDEIRDVLTRLSVEIEEELDAEGPADG